MIFQLNDAPQWDGFCRNKTLKLEQWTTSPMPPCGREEPGCPTGYYAADQRDPDILGALPSADVLNLGWLYLARLPWHKCTCCSKEHLTYKATQVFSMDPCMSPRFLTRTPGKLASLLRVTRVRWALLRSHRGDTGGRYNR